MLRRHTRLSIPASLHFVTTTVNARGNWFVNSARTRKLLKIFEECRSDIGILCLSYVLMPDHFHTQVYQPAPDEELGQVHVRPLVEISTGVHPFSGQWDVSRHDRGTGLI